MIKFNYLTNKMNRSHKIYYQKKLCKLQKRNQYQIEKLIDKSDKYFVKNNIINTIAVSLLMKYGCYSRIHLIRGEKCILCDDYHIKYQIFFNDYKNIKLCIKCKPEITKRYNIIKLSLLKSLFYIKQVFYNRDLQDLYPSILENYINITKQVNQQQLQTLDLNNPSIKDYIVYLKYLFN